MSAPRFSVVTPVHDPPPDLLEACIDSIMSQTLGDWEWCVADDGSRSPAVISRLRSLAEDARVRLLTHERSSGIVAASNSALTLAKGEWIVLLDHDDCLEPHALAAVAEAIDARPDVDYVYSDEDKLALDGTRYGELLKPDWSPERLRAQNYCTHLSVLRRAIVTDVGGFREGFDGRQDHDLILRVTERARRVHHVPEILYHWCVTPGSAAGDPAAKPHAQALGVRTIGDHLDRVGIDATVQLTENPGNFRVVRRVEDPPTVSVIIPTAGTSREVWGIDRPLIYRCLDSLCSVTEYPSMEVVVVLDPKTRGRVVAEIERWRRQDIASRTVVAAGDEFNFSRRINLGAGHASGELLVLLNDDVLVEQRDWLERMVGFTAEPDVGIVGCRLLYGDGTLQHGGILCNEQPLHIFHGFAGDEPGPFGLLQIDREVSAVTAACMLTPRRVFDEMGGLPEHFAVAFNDLEYCLRVRDSGRRIIWTPQATLSHFESQSRGRGVSPDEVDELYRRWGEQLRHDPYGNPQFAPYQAEWVPRWRADTSLGIRRRLRTLRNVADIVRRSGELTPSVNAARHRHRRRHRPRPRRHSRR